MDNIPINMITDKGKRRYSPDLEAGLFLHTENELLALEFVSGSLTSKKAIFAHIAKNRTGTMATKTEVVYFLNGRWNNIYVIPGTHYRNITNLDLIISMNLSKTEESTFFMDGTIESPSPWFLPTFSRIFKDIPVLEEWKFFLWNAGMEENLINSILIQNVSNCWQFGAPGTVFNQEKQQEKWMKLIQKGLESGAICIPEEVK